MGGYPCCCGGCRLCADDFNRSDSSDIDTGSACGWDSVGVSATWGIASHCLAVSCGGGAGLLICQTPNPGRSEIVESLTVVSPGDGGGFLLLICNYQDGDNYTKAEFDLATSELEVVDIVAGTPTSL